MHTQTVLAITCSPHRVGHLSCVAVQITGEKVSVNLLLTLTGNLLLTLTGSLRWPTAQDYAHSPRWYIHLPDAVDAVYLVAQVVERLGIAI